MRLFQFFSSSLVLLLGFLVMTQAAKARSYKTDIYRKCGGDFNLCGFKDPKTEQFVIPQKFEYTSQLLAEGLTRVRIKGRYGYINKQGKVIVAPQYDGAGEFYNGLAEVMIKGKAGVINMKGKMVVRPQFTRVFPFSKELVIASNDPWITVYDYPSFRETLESFN